MDCCGSGALSRLAIGLASAPNPTRLDFTHVYGTSVVKHISDGSSQTIRGTLDRVDSNVGEGMLIVRFRVQMWMTALKNEILLPVMGFTNVSTLWTLGDSLPETTAIVGPAAAPETTYGGCVITDWVASGRKGDDPILWDIGFIGKTRTPNPIGTFFVSQTDPAMTEGYTYPYPSGSYSHTQYTYMGATRHFPLFQLRHNYHVIDEYLNSVNATNLCPTDHDLTFGTNALYSTCDSTTDLLSEPMSGDTTGSQLIVDLQRTVGSDVYQTQFDVANVKLIARDFDISKNAFNRLPIFGRGYAPADGSRAMLQITNVVP